MEDQEYDELIEEARIRLRNFRKDQGLKQREFAEMLGWTQSEQSNLETGIIKWNIKRIMTVAKYFGMSPVFFLPRLLLTANDEDIHEITNIMREKRRIRKI